MVVCLRFNDLLTSSIVPFVMSLTSRAFVLGARAQYTFALSALAHLRASRTRFCPMAILQLTRIVAGDDSGLVEISNGLQA